MARMEVSGADVLIAGLADMITSTPKLRDAILAAEADVLEPGLKASISENGLVETGTLQNSIKRRTATMAGEKVIRIGPTGTHHYYMPTGKKSGIATANDVGYVHEYGSPRRGIRPKEWVRKALERNKSAAYQAADNVYQKYVNKNLGGK